MATLLSLPLARIVDDNGDPIAGARLHAYLTETTTPTPVYTTAAMNVEHTNPVVADEGTGLLPPIFIDPTVTYRFKAKTSEGVDIPGYDFDPVTVSSSGSIQFQQAGDGTTLRTVESKLAEFFTATDFDGVEADGTDQTAALIAGINAHVGDTDRKTVIIPPGVAWHPQELFADSGVAAKERLTIVDLGGMNAARKAGENTKIFGVFGVDPDATEDTYWGVSSGHHPVFMLNNMNTSDTESAEQGFMSLLFARGFWTDGAENDRSFRGAMIGQYRRSLLDTTQWEMAFRSLSPWEALADGIVYERWAATTDYGVDDYVVTTGDKIYKCTIAGTSGATPPSHTTGTAADGTVTWQYIDTNDRLVFSFDQQGRIKSNGATTATDLLAVKQATTDTSSSAVFRISGTGLSKTVRLIGEPTNGSGVLVASPGFTWTTAGILELRDSAGTLIASAEGDNKGLKFQMQRNAWASAADADTTPSVQNIATLYVSNTGATSITALDDGTDGQLVEIIATNSNTTLNHGAALNLTGSANQALSAWSSITFRKVPTAISNRWVEVARSIK